MIKAQLPKRLIVVVVAAVAVLAAISGIVLYLGSQSGYAVGTESITVGR